MNKIYAYCDGVCNDNQFENNVGGWGVVLKFHGKSENTTNKIMELTSCIEALKNIKDKDIPVEVIMDSQYVIQGINKWVEKCAKKDWVDSHKKPIENKELWIELLKLKNEFKDIKFIESNGHLDDEGISMATEFADIGMYELD